MLLYYNGLTSCHPVGQQMLETRITCLRRLRIFFAHVADGCAFVRMISFFVDRRAFSSMPHNDTMYLSGKQPKAFLERVRHQLKSFAKVLWWFSAF